MVYETPRIESRQAVEALMTWVEKSKPKPPGRRPGNHS